jgi:sugar phosphate isomerase/epimerase
LRHLPCGHDRGLGHAGRDAARASAAELGARPDAASLHTLSLFVACAPATAERAAANVSDERLFVLPARFDGKECVVLCWGTYASADEARAAAATVAPYFAKGGAKPSVRRLDALLHAR